MNVYLSVFPINIILVKLGAILLILCLLLKTVDFVPELTNKSERCLMLSMSPNLAITVLRQIQEILLLFLLFVHIWSGTRGLQESCNPKRRRKWQSRFKNKKKSPNLLTYVQILLRVHITLKG